MVRSVVLQRKSQPRRNTAAHEAVVRERDKAFQVGGANSVALLVHFVCVASYVLLLYNTAIYLP